MPKREFPRGQTVYGPLSKRDRRRQRLSYRFTPPIPAHFNCLQRTIRRVQRLLLGDTSGWRVRR